MGKAQFNLHLSTDMHHTVIAAAGRADRSASSWIRQAISEKLERDRAAAAALDQLRASMERRATEADQ